MPPFLLHTYPTATAFLARMQPILEQHEARNGLMLGICLRLVAHPERITAPPYLAAVEDADGVAAAAMITPPHGVVLTSDRAECGDALRVLADDLAGRRWPLPTVHGLRPLARAFAAAWSEMTGATATLAIEERLYELRQVAPLAYSPGKLRLATADDVDLVAQWMMDFNAEALGDLEPTSWPQARSNAENRIRDGGISFWEDGRPVCLVGVGRPTAHGIAIAPVYTPPDLRGRGYATSCVARVSQRMLDQGRSFCTLFTDLANPTANHVYQRIGYRPIGDFTVYRFNG
jgi:hypothetical protein